MRLHAFALAAALVLTACKPEAGSGKPPNLAVLDLAGNPVSLADYAGKPVLLNFWLGGCAPCLTEIPTLQALHAAHAAEGLAVLSINVGGNAAVAADMQARVDYAVVRDALGLTATRYQIGAFPTNVVIGRDGRVRARLVEADAAKLVVAVEGVL